VLGALHGLILLPVLLSLFGPGACDKGDSPPGSKKAPQAATPCENQNPDNAVVAAANAIAITVAPQSNGKIGSNNHHSSSNGGGGKKHHKHQASIS
jgi:hypothetical protein